MLRTLQYTEQRLLDLGWSCLLIMAFISCLPGFSVFGQKPVLGDSTTGALSDDPLYSSWRTNPSVTQCGVCHYSPTNEFAGRETDFCELSEARQWLDRDKHAISRQRIEPLSREQVSAKRADLRRSFSNAQSAAAKSPESLFGDSNVVSYSMCEKLGYDINTVDGYSRFRENCLTCHAGYDVQRSQPSLTPTDSDHPGIECNSCHQVSSQRLAASGEDELPWIALHSNKKWRLMPPAEKAELGMRQLVDAAPQAELCASCHIGDHAQGMFVTHAMYAAGHPPLPGFEFQTYVSALPPHWRGLRETATRLAQFPGRSAYFSLNVEGFETTGNLDVNFWETRAVLIGAIKAAERSVAMLAEAEERWGDYALYDCAACHHELRIPSARQARPLIGAPGRPRLPEWPTPLLDLALDMTGEHAAEVESLRHQLMKAVSQSPFGSQADCVPAAERLESALSAAVTTLARQPIGARQANNLLLALCGQQTGEANRQSIPTTLLEDRLIDYQAARQVVWAIQTIDRELHDHGQSLSVPARELIANLGKVEHQVILSTQLPSEQSARHYEADHDSSRSGFLEAELQRIKQFDHDLIVRQLQELGELIE